MERMTTFEIMRSSYTCYFDSSSLLLTKTMEVLMLSYLICQICKSGYFFTCLISEMKSMIPIFFAFSDTSNLLLNCSLNLKKFNLYNIRRFSHERLKVLTVWILHTEIHDHAWLIWYLFCTDKHLTKRAI